VSLAIQPQLEIEGVGGPNLQITATLAASVNFIARPYFTITASAAVQVGLDINFLTVHKSIEYTLATKTIGQYSINSPPNVTLTVLPSNPTISAGRSLQMSAKRSDGRVFAITSWRLQGSTSSEHITSSGLLTVGYPASRSFTVIAQDQAGAIGETSVTISNPPPPGTPGPPSGVKATGVAQTSATIQWSPPSSDGGSPITKYQVTNVGSGCTTTSTSCQITGLTADTSYSACVVAFNVAGAGAQSCVSFKTLPPNPVPVDIYNNYGSGAAGIPMCRGNPNFPNSMPGGTASQSMTVPSGVEFVDQVMIQIDPAPTQVFADLQIFENGNLIYDGTQGTNGDTVWSFDPLSVSPGDQLTLQLSFSANSGQIITIYQVGNPGGTLTVSNSCPNDNESFSTTSSGLRAVVTGLT